MKTILIAAIVAGTALGAITPADARQGCGPGEHRGPRGYCRPNRGGSAMVPGLRVGVYTPGRGYWDGQRYWGHRDRWHGGWRYR